MNQTTDNHTNEQDDERADVEELDASTEITLHHDDADAEQEEVARRRLQDDVEEYLDLTAQIKQSNAELKIVRESMKIINSRKGVLGERISKFMTDNAIGVLQSKKSGAKIKLSQRTKPCKVDRPYLEESLSSKIGKDKARELVSYAYETRSTEETSSLSVVAKKS